MYSNKSGFTFQSRGATAFSSEDSSDIDRDDDSAAVADLLNSADDKSSRGKVLTRVEADRVSNLWRKKKSEPKEEENDEEASVEFIDEKKPNAHKILEEFSPLPLGTAPSKGILKNKETKEFKARSAVNRAKEAGVSKLLSLEDSTIDLPTKRDDHKMMTNMKLKSWSVSSFDSCAADTRRTYAAYLTTNAKSRFGFRTFAMFKIKNDEEAEIERHEDSDYEDNETYGPHESDYYNKRSKNTTFQKLKKIASLGTIKRKKSNPKSRQNRSKSRIGALSKMFTLNRGKSMDGEAGENEEDMEEIQAPDNQEEELENMKNMLREKRNKKQKATEEEQNEIDDGENADVEDNKESEDGIDPIVDDESIEGMNKRPKYIPPDLVWDPKYNDGKGGLVNKEPQFIPPGKFWRQEANNGAGGLVNKPKLVHPPNQVWNWNALNGQGGLVNIKPSKLPRGKKWDYEAFDGMGGLVDLSEEELSKEKEERAKKKKERKDRKKKPKEQPLSPAQNELLAEITAESNEVFAKLDRDKDGVESRATELDKREAELEERESQLDIREAELTEREKEVEDLSRTIRPQQLKNFLDDEFPTLDVEVQFTDEPGLLPKLESSKEQTSGKIRLKSLSLDKLPKEFESDEEVSVIVTKPRKRRGSVASVAHSMTSLAARGLRKSVSSLKSLVKSITGSRKSKSSAKSKSTGLKTPALQAQRTTSTDTGTNSSNPFGIEEGRVKALFDKFERPIRRSDGSLESEVGDFGKKALI